MFDGRECESELLWAEMRLKRGQIADPLKGAARQRPGIAVVMEGVIVPNDNEAMTGSGEGYVESARFA